MSGEGEGRAADQVRGDERDRVRGDDKWHNALAAFEAAAGELGRYEAFCRGRGYAEQSALEAGYDLRSDAMYDALRRLLRAPAPDVAALAAKLDLAVRHEVATLTGGDQCLAALSRDAWRLAGRPATAG
jgi:hypothetical protein